MNLTIFDTFKKVSGYDIKSYLMNYLEFVNNHYPNIINYYNGANINQNSFTFFDNFKKESLKVESFIDRNSNVFNTTEYWDLIDLISDIQNSVYKVESMARWLRSSRTDRFSPNIKKTYIQKQNETIEDISNSFGFSNQDSWVDLAISNQIEEEAYTNTGGKFLKASFLNNSNFDLENIVDTLSEQNVYGKDIQKEFVFENNDLKVLVGKESLEQTYGTIMSTMSRSIPEFPSIGVPDYLFGTNQNVIQYPVLFRSLMSMFQTDKRFISFEIIDIKKDKETITIETQTKTIMGDTFTNNVVL